MKTPNDIINEMVEVMPYHLNSNLKPYIVEAMEIYAKEYHKQKVEKLNIVSFSVSDSSDFELQRLFDWLQDSKREPAQTKFTSGMTRNLAREIEYLLKHSR